MTVKTYARIQGGVVVELLRSALPASTLFHTGLAWVDISNQPNVTTGWTFDGTNFTRPAPVAAPAELPTMAQLLADVATLKAELAILKRQVTPAAAHS